MPRRTQSQLRLLRLWTAPRPAARGAASSYQENARPEHAPPATQTVHEVGANLWTIGASTAYARTSRKTNIGTLLWKMQYKVYRRISNGHKHPKT
eukprot:356395-Chlamydomonas_euryale.AAC.12